MTAPAAATLPLDLAAAIVADLLVLRPALSITRALFLPRERTSLETLRVFVAPTGRTHKAATRRHDEHRLRVEVATVQNLPGPDYDAQAAAVLATALDLYALWTANSDDDDEDGPFRKKTPAHCKFVEADHDPLLEPSTLGRGLAVSLFTLTYTATLPQ